MQIFNNREIALAIWAAVGLVFALSKDSIREALGALVKHLFARLIVTHLGVMTIYISLVVVCLSKLGLWELPQLKNTIIWSFMVGAVSLFRISSIAEDRSYFRNALKDSFRVVVVIEFVVAFYTFDLIVELLFLPFTALLGMMIAFAGGDRENQILERLLNGILITIVICMILFAGNKILTDYHNFFSLKTFHDFYLPPLLTILFLPYVFILVLWVSYEHIFLRLRFSIKDDDLRRYAKRKGVFAFGANTELLKRWSLELNVTRITDRHGIQKTIDEVFEIRKREKNPPVVPIEQGWSPFLAAKFLDEEGLVGGVLQQDH